MKIEWKNHFVMIHGPKRTWSIFLPAVWHENRMGQIEFFAVSWWPKEDS